jgi:hypothetical protein
MERDKGRKGRLREGTGRVERKGVEKGRRGKTREADPKFFDKSDTANATC